MTRRGALVLLAFAAASILAVASPAAAECHVLIFPTPDPEGRFPSLFFSICPPVPEGGEEPDLYVFRNNENHKDACMGLRISGGGTFVCILNWNGPVPIPPGEPPEPIPIPPDGSCADMHVFIDKETLWTYYSWCFPSGEQKPGEGEPPYVYIRENNENNPHNCVGVRVVDGHFFACQLRGPIPDP